MFALPHPPKKYRVPCLSFIICGTVKEIEEKGKFQVGHKLTQTHKC
jgi:hypothetical protein